MPHMLLIFAGLAGLFFVLERLIPWRPQRIFRTGIVADVVYAPLHIALRILINMVVASALALVGRSAGVQSIFGFNERLPVWAQALTLIFVLDFAFYVTHRLKHRWRWWWRLHETHHSSKDLDYLSAARFHPLEKILDRTLFLLPLTLLNPATGALLIWSSWDALMGMLIHSNANIRLGPLIYIFVGPEMHRWHHSRDRKLSDCNFGNSLSIFDWIFGTAYVSYERDADFGVQDEQYPQNNLWKQFWYAFRQEPSRVSVTQETGEDSAERIEQSKAA